MLKYETAALDDKLYRVFSRQARTTIEAYDTYEEAEEAARRLAEERHNIYVVLGPYTEFAPDTAPVIRTDYVE